MVLDNVAAGVARSELLASYSSVAPSDIDAALAYAAELARESTGYLPVELSAFKTDENLPPEAASVPRDHGFEAETVWDESLSGADDAAIAIHPARDLVRADYTSRESRMPAAKLHPSDHGNGISGSGQR